MAFRSSNSYGYLSKYRSAHRKHHDKVLLIYTGGTIGMDRDPNDYNTLKPVQGNDFEKKVNRMPELHTPEIPKYDIITFSPLIDSANMNPSDWKKIGQTIFENYDKYDGFVVLHGTDTMAYTASALSFMFQNLSKSIVLTGSQVPFCEAYSDARRNLVMSIICAGILCLPEVCIFFNDQLMRGNRSMKASNDAFRAFESPNFPPLATMGVGITVDEGLALPQPPIDAVLRFIPEMDSSIVVLRLVPGFDDDCITCIAENSNTKAIVLMLYGTGNAPDTTIKKGAFVKALREASKFTQIVICTQCPAGQTDLEAYAVGRQFLNMGILNSADMTVEAVVTKMAHLLAIPDLGKDDFHRLWNKNLRGERSAGEYLIRPPNGLIARKVTFPSLSRIELKKMFEEFDTSANGVIDFKEFALGMKDLGKNLNRVRQKLEVEMKEDKISGNYMKDEMKSAKEKIISSAHKKRFRKKEKAKIRTLDWILIGAMITLTVAILVIKK
eukprot:g2982.t1